MVFPHALAISAHSSRVQGGEGGILKGEKWENAEIHLGVLSGRWPRVVKHPKPQWRIFQCPPQTEVSQHGASLSTAGFKFSLTIEWWTLPPVWTRLLDLAEIALMERRPAAATRSADPAPSAPNPAPLSLGRTPAAARRRAGRGRRRTRPRGARWSWSRPETRAAGRARPRTRPAGSRSSARAAARGRGRGGRRFWTGTPAARRSRTRRSRSAFVRPPRSARPWPRRSRPSVATRGRHLAHPVGGRGPDAVEQDPALTDDERRSALTWQLVAGRIFPRPS